MCKIPEEKVQKSDASLLAGGYIKQIQGRNSFKVGKYSVDPDNTEYAGSHDNDEHGGKAFA